MAELWDVYDRDRNKTGRTHLRGTPLSAGEYQLVIHVWVRDKEGRFLLTRRAPDKYPFPDCWECTGGSALAGETSETAALRETYEETGLDHTASRRTCMISYTRGDWHGDVWLFDAEFTAADVRLQDGETTDLRLATRDEVLALVRAGKFCGYDYVEKLMAML